MPRLRRALPERAIPGLVFGLLCLTFASALVLAYEAYQVDQSRRHTADRLLRDYARFAAWQLGRSAREDLSTGIRAILRPVMAVAGGVAPLPHPSVLTPARGKATSCGCPVADTVHEYFRLELPQQRLTTACGAPPLLAKTRSTDALVKHAAEAYQPSWDFATLFVPGKDHAHAVTYTLVHDARGAPVAAYGFKTPVEAFGGPIFRRTLARSALLPPALTRGVPNDSLLSVALTSPTGDTLFRSRKLFTPQYAAADTVTGTMGGMVVSVSLNAAAAKRLLIDNSSSSRLPFWLALLTLNAVLIAIAVRQLARERDLVRARAEFVSRLSHEIRTPLSEIRVYAEMLRLGRTRSEAERRRSLEVIDEQAARLTHLADNVLHFSHSRAACQRVQPRQVALATEIRHIVEAYTPLVTPLQVHLQLHLDDGVQASLDPCAFHQALLNLLDNAVRHSRPHQVVTVGLTRRNDLVRVWVGDQGPGIPPADRKRVFDPYVRTESGSGPATKGCGLGLAVVREIVDLHDGDVWVEEEIGGGARLVMEFPMSREDLDKSSPGSTLPTYEHRAERERASA